MGTTKLQHLERLARARCALDGLSVGDGFGDRWFYVTPSVVLVNLRMKIEPAPLWSFTDDTQMALSIYSILRQFQMVDQDQLALSFVRQYDPQRKYGAAMRGLFMQIKLGTPWRAAAQSLFGGQGSFGNGAAMRVAPIGGYYADDLPQAAEQARRSAEVTHAHPEGIAGAIAVAVATAVAWQARTANIFLTRQDFIERIVPFIPDSEVRRKTILARDMAENGITLDSVVEELGNGLEISAQDTVPFCLWSAGEHLKDYETALWQTTRAGGDIDTNCAIVGGIVAMSVGIEGIPARWLHNREPLPAWAFTED